MESPKTVNHRLYLLPVWLLMGAVLTGCQSDTYYWGHYENLVYVSYAKPDKVSPQMQAEVMERDQYKADSEKKPLPPGFHAHLGYEYFLIGRNDLALLQFQKEKTEFPESTVFMDRLIASLSKK
jgi:hypothetical protein